MKFIDAAHTGTVKRTSEGYLIANARALRTGVQEYMAWEFGDMAIADGFDRDAVIRVYRPEESVRAPESMQSLSHSPVTMGHPTEMVDSENWKDLAIGEVSTAATWDGEFISIPLILKDAAAIRAVEDGTAQLSAGYEAEMKRTVHADYDYVMQPPKYNHIAVVDKARAGDKARIGDGANKWGISPQPEERSPKVELIKVQVGDNKVSVAAADADAVLALVADHAKALADKDAEIAALKIECADANKAIKTDAEIAQLVQDGVAELAEVADKARALVADYDAAGKDAMTIRREVIAKVYGDEAIADLVTDAEVKAAFKVAKSVAKADPVLTRDAKPEEEIKDNGQSAYEKRLNDAWKGAK